MEKTKLEDISKITISVLIIFTMVVSVLGTWFFLDAINNAIDRTAISQIRYGTNTNANVAVEILAIQEAEDTSDVLLNIESAPTA